MSSVPTSHHVGRWGWEVGGVGGGWEVTQLMSNLYQPPTMLVGGVGGLN